MRAEQGMMLVVGALGLYAVYRLTRKDAGTPPPEPVMLPAPVQPGPFPVPAPVPVPVPVPSGQLPAMAGPPGAFPATLGNALADPLLLQGGGWVKGRLETGSNGPLLPGLTRDQLASAITAATGLERVRVYVTPEEAATTIAQSFALANAGQGTRWFWGRLPALGNTRPRKPSWLVALWKAAAPPDEPQPMARVAGLPPALFASHGRYPRR